MSVTLRLCDACSLLRLGLLGLVELQHAAETRSWAVQRIQQVGHRVGGSAV